MLGKGAYSDTALDNFNKIKFVLKLYVSIWVICYITRYRDEGVNC